MTRVPYALKWPVGVLAWLAALQLYGAINAWTFPRARLVELSALDAAIPFVPWTAGIYWTGWLFVGLCWCLAGTSPHYLRQLLALGLSLTIGCAAFLLFPARYPREAVLPPDAPEWVQWALDLLWTVDLPGNTLPSLHAALAVALALEVWRPGCSHGRFWRAVTAAWAAALVASALTTRQHTTLDVVAGVALGAVVHVLVGRWTRA